MIRRRVIVTPKRLARRFAIATVLLGGFTPDFAFAQQQSEPTASELAIARRLFREATELRDKGDFAGAEAKLRQVIDLKESAGVRLHLGHALEKQGRLVEALASYDRAEELLRAGAREPAVEQALGPAREALRARIPTVTVRCAKTCQVDKILIDGTAVAAPALDKAIPVDPGKHRIEVHAANHSPYAIEVDAEEGGKHSLVATWPEPSVGAGAGATAPATSGAEAADDAQVVADRAPSNTKTLVLVGEGAFALTGIVLGLVFRSAADSAEDRAVDQRAELFARTGTPNSCSNPSGEIARLCDELEQSNDDRLRNNTFATVSLVAAGVGVGAMLATELLWKQPSSSTASAPRFVGTASPGAFGIGFMGALP